MLSSWVELIADIAEAGLDVLIGSLNALAGVLLLDILDG
jgi:hypothetical protein